MCNRCFLSAYMRTCDKRRRNERCWLGAWVVVVVVPNVELMGRSAAPRIEMIPSPFHSLFPTSLTIIRVRAVGVFNRLWNWGKRLTFFYLPNSCSSKPTSSTPVAYAPLIAFPESEVCLCRCLCSQHFIALPRLSPYLFLIFIRFLFANFQSCV